MPGFEPGGLAKEQPALVHHGEDSEETPRACAVEETVNLVEGKHVGELFLAADPDFVPRLSIAVQMIGEMQRRTQEA